MKSTTDQKEKSRRSTKKEANSKVSSVGLRRLSLSPKHPVNSHPSACGVVVVSRRMDVSVRLCVFVLSMRHWAVATPSLSFLQLEEGSAWLMI